MIVWTVSPAPVIWQMFFPCPFVSRFLPVLEWADFFFLYIFWHIFERGWSLNSKPINVSGHTSIHFNWPWMTKEAQNSYFGISTSIFRMRTFKNFFRSCYWGSSPQRCFSFSFTHIVNHHRGANSGSTYNFFEKSWLLDNVLWFSLV